jgi:polyhydroxyalkanoate synthesis regulator phasin
VSDLINKALLSALGLASLTKDAIRKTAEDLVDQSKLSEDEGRKLVEDLHRRSVQAQKALEKKVESVVHKVLKNLDPAILTNLSKPAAKKSSAKSPRTGRKRKAGQ